MPRIDAHAHVFARPSAQFPRAVDEDCPAGREEPVGKLLEAMHANRIGQTVLVQIGSAEGGAHAYLPAPVARAPRSVRASGGSRPGPPRKLTHWAGWRGGIIGFSACSRRRARAKPVRADRRAAVATYRIWKHAAAKTTVIWCTPAPADAHLIPKLLEQFRSAPGCEHLGICPRGAASATTAGPPRHPTAHVNSRFHTTYRLEPLRERVVSCPASRV